MSVAIESRRTLLAALVLTALVALVVHYLAHPFLSSDQGHPGQQIFRGSFVAASLLPLLDLVVVSGLFLSRRTAPLAYLLNGLLAIYGTVLMGHYGIVGLADTTAGRAPWIFRSMLIDIALVWVDFLVGKALFDSWMREA